MFGWFQRDRLLNVLNSLEVWGGVEKVTLHEILSLRAKGFRVEVCVLRTANEVADEYRRQGIPVHVIPVYRALPNRTQVSWRGMLRLWCFMIRRRYGVIVTGQQQSGYFARLLAFPTLGRRLFAIERTQTRGRKLLHRFLDRLLAHWTRLIICISGEVRDGLVEESGVPAAKVVVCEHGIPEPPPLAATPRYEHPALANSFVFGCVGRLVPGKQQAVLLEAFARVHREIGGCAMLLVGGGELEDELKSLAKRLGVADRVVFSGAVNVVAPFYRAMHCFTFTSISEGLGAVFIEAWMFGLPLICTAIRPMKDYVRDGINGLLFPANDVNALAARMRQMASDPALRRQLADAGHQTAEEKFNLERQNQRLFELLRRS